MIMSYEMIAAAYPLEAGTRPSRLAIHGDTLSRYKVIRL